MSRNHPMNEAAAADQRILDAELVAAAFDLYPHLDALEALLVTSRAPAPLMAVFHNMAGALEEAHDHFTMDHTEAAATEAITVEPHHETLFILGPL